MERKEAIEIIKKNWPDSNFTMLREALETLIPELKESEDERIRKAILEHIQLCTESIPDRDKFIVWLEKRRVQPQNTWKPSGEQMKFLWKYAEQNNYDGSILTSLYNDLEKLRKE